MDWRFNTIWFEQLNQKTFFKKNFKENTISSVNENFEESEYAILWHLKERQNAFENLPANEQLLYLELNWANIKNFWGIEKFTNLKRLELHSCVKLESDFGIGRLSHSLEFLYVGTSKKFKITDELLQLKKLRVLCLNSSTPLDNLNFLKNFPNLICFRFVDTNVLDGNLSPILEHPTIRSVGFSNKRHYNFSDIEMNRKLEDKSREEFKTVVYKGEFQTFRYDFE